MIDPYKVLQYYDGPEVPLSFILSTVELYNTTKAHIMDLQRIAHILVDKARYAGELRKPACCEECGDINFRLHAHHEDYSLPLSVEWLCSKCHQQRHKVTDMALFATLSKLTAIPSVREGAD